MKAQERTLKIAMKDSLLNNKVVNHLGIMIQITRSYLTDMTSQRNTQIQNMTNKIICKTLMANGYHFHHQIPQKLQILMS